MNKERRKRIADICAMLADLRDQIDSILEDETEYLECMPDGIRESDRGERAEEACGYLEQALEAVDEATNNLDEASA